MQHAGAEQAHAVRVVRGAVGCAGRRHGLAWSQQQFSCHVHDSLRLGQSVGGCRLREAHGLQRL